MRIVYLTMCVAALLAPNPTHAQETYILEEGTDYTGNGCNAGDLNTVTASLQSALNADGWAGDRYVNGDTYPQDFFESCSSNYGSGGWDHLYADADTLTVFAGHASVGNLLFPTAQSGVCNVDFSANMRLGSMNGAESGIAMYLACDELQINSLPNEANHQWLRQQLGFRNVIGIGDDEPRDFFNATVGSTNTTAWLNQMDGSGRMPIAVSYGTDETNCNDVKSSAKLKNGNLVTDRPSTGPACNAGNPSFWFCYSYI